MFRVDRPELASRMRRKDLAKRMPLYCHVDGGLWDRREVGEARKRVAARHYIARNSTIPRVELTNMNTSQLVVLCQTIKDLTDTNY